MGISIGSVTSAVANAVTSAAEGVAGAAEDAAEGITDAVQDTFTDSAVQGPTASLQPCCDNNV